MANACRLQRQEERVKDQVKEQGGQLVTLLLPAREVDGRRPSIGKVGLVMCMIVQGLQQVDIRDVELTKPPPQRLMIDAVECIFKV